MSASPNSTDNLKNQRDAKHHQSSPWCTGAPRRSIKSSSADYGSSATRGGTPCLDPEKIEVDSALQPQGWKS
jgi:hypothetical protein